MLSHQEARACFPALESGFAFLENAGGSQVPQIVLDRMSAFMLEEFVQLGAGYGLSEKAGATVAEARAFVESLLAAPPASVALGASTTALVRMLADCYSRTLQPGDRVVISLANHEANIGAWERLARFDIEPVWWGVDECGPRMEELPELLDERVKIVTLAHTSNLLGDTVDAAEVCRLAHDFGAKVVCDGVAHVPHGSVDVAALDMDFYVFSAYKLFGPHIAAVYGKPELWRALPTPNHFFFEDNDFPHRFEIGCLSYEACAGLIGTRDYFDRLGSSPFERITEWEAPLASALLEWLDGRDGFRLLGPALSSHRAPTVSFVHDSVAPAKFTAAARAAGIGVRDGHMYAYRLCEALGVPPETGVVRVSPVHYNTIAEIERLLDVWSKIG